MWASRREIRIDEYEEGIRIVECGQAGENAAISRWGAVEQERESNLFVRARQNI